MQIQTDQVYFDFEAQTEPEPERADLQMQTDLKFASLFAQTDPKPICHTLKIQTDQFLFDNIIQTEDPEQLDYDAQTDSYLNQIETQTDPVFSQSLETQTTTPDLSDLDIQTESIELGHTGVQAYANDSSSIQTEPITSSEATTDTRDLKAIMSKRICFAVEVQTDPDGMLYVAANDNKKDSTGTQTNTRQLQQPERVSLVPVVEADSPDRFWVNEDSRATGLAKPDLRIAVDEKRRYGGAVEE